MTAGINPARYSESVINALRDLIQRYSEPSDIVFDPFAGEGRRLGALCDELGRVYAGSDLVKWANQDPRVEVADSTLPGTYPEHAFIVVTSPTYSNGMNDGFIPRDTSRRMTYTVAAGERLAETNTGRWSGRAGKTGERRYWEIHRDCVKHWPTTAIVNVKDSIRAKRVYPCVQMWCHLLGEQGYDIIERVECPVPSNRFGQNHEARLDHEAILIARRS